MGGELEVVPPPVVVVVDPPPPPPGSSKQGTSLQRPPSPTVVQVPPIDQQFASPKLGASGHEQSPVQSLEEWLIVPPHELPT